MAKGTFGEHLKREREMRGVSLDEISTATRIGTRFLEAMENEQWERLPGGVFNRGFVRAVARFLGLDEENLVAEYALAAQDRTDLAAATLRTPPPSTNGRRPLWLVVLLLVALAAGGWFAWHRYVAWRAARAARGASDFQAQGSFQVSASNSSAVLLELNGQTVVPFGAPGRPGRLTLSRKDSKKPSGGPD